MLTVFRIHVATGRNRHSLSFTTIHGVSVREPGSQRFSAGRLGRQPECT